MTKAILIFDLSEEGEKEDFDYAVKGFDYKCALINFESFMHNIRRNQIEESVYGEEAMKLFHTIDTAFSNITDGFDL